MNCRYCGQWNPDEAQRCCFCANARDALEDTTAAPRPARAQGEAVLPERPREPSLVNPLRVRGPEPEFQRTLRHAEYTVAIVGGIIATLFGLLYLLGRC